METVLIDKEEYYIDQKRQLVIKTGEPNKRYYITELFVLYDENKVKMKLKDIDKVTKAYHNR